MSRYDKMDKAELIAALLSLKEKEQTNPSKDPAHAPHETKEDEWKRLVHELQVHQVELEMQNRELQEAQQALEVSRNRFVDLYDFAPVGYLTLDEKGCILEINLSGSAMLGEKRSRLIGEPFVPYVNQGDIPHFFSHLKKCRCTDIKVSTDLALSPKGGESLSVHLASVAVRDEKQQTVVYRTTITDITERKHAEVALQKMHDTLEIRVAQRTEALDQANAALLIENQVRREAEGKLRSVLEAAPDAILMTDQNGRILYANKQADRMFVCVRGALIGQPIGALLPERFRSAHVGHYQGYIKAPKTRPMGEGLNLFALRKDGSEFPVEISLSPLKTEQGLLVTSIIRDVTQRRQTEEILRSQACTLEEKVRELDDFTHMVSHGLKEPLRGISAFSSILLEDYGTRLDAKAQEHLHFLKECADRMEDLIEALLTLAGISRKDHTFTEVDLNPLLTDLQEELAFSINEKRVEIRCASPLPSLRCDPIQITEVFKNLLSNAIKFNTATPPIIEIAAKDAGPFYLFSVKDNGIGIDPRYAERIFRLFERLHPQEKFAGTGAGLAICKKVIDQHGGKIWLESQPGEGACFFFTLPKNVK